jgi:hypothetical protein
MAASGRVQRRHRGDLAGDEGGGRAARDRDVVAGRRRFADGGIAGLGASLLLAKSFRDKHAMEVMLADSDREWIAVRPGILTNGKPRGVWRTDVDGELRSGKIARADVAAFMLQQLASDDWLRKRPVIVW